MECGRKTLLGVIIIVFSCVYLYSGQRNNDKVQLIKMPNISKFIERNDNPDSKIINKNDILYLFNSQTTNSSYIVCVNDKNQNIEFVLFFNELYSNIVNYIVDDTMYYLLISEDGNLLITSIDDQLIEVSDTDIVYPYSIDTGTTKMNIDDYYFTKKSEGIIDFMDDTYYDIEQKSKYVTISIDSFRYPVNDLNPIFEVNNDAYSLVDIALQGILFDFNQEKSEIQ